MAKPKLEDEIERRFAEPLLPVEKKLIGWSLGIGLVSLIVLAVISRFLPS
jgi:hypothetical protein